MQGQQENDEEEDKEKEKEKLIEELKGKGSHQKYMILTKNDKYPVLYKCKLCNAELTREYTFRMHILGHFQIKLHECPICKKKYRSRQYLREHMNMHTGAKPFACPEPGCNKRFRHSTKLALHRRRTGHGQTLQRRGSELESGGEDEEEDPEMEEGADKFDFRNMETSSKVSPSGSSERERNEVESSGSDEADKYLGSGSSTASSRQKDDDSGDTEGSKNGERSIKDHKAKHGQKNSEKKRPERIRKRVEEIFRISRDRESKDLVERYLTTFNVEKYVREPLEKPFLMMLMDANERRTEFSQLNQLILQRYGSLSTIAWIRPPAS